MTGATRRDFRLLWLGETVSALGTGVTGVALPLVAVLRLDAGSFTVGVLMAASWLPWLIIGLPAGAWVDRLPRKPVMVGCDMASCALFASIPIAAALGVLTIAQLLVVAVLAGCATVFFRTAVQVYLPGLVADADLMEANTKLHAGESAALVAGPGVGGLVAQAFGAVGGVLVDAVSYLLSAACLLSVRTVENRPPAIDEGTLRNRIADGMRFVFADPYLRTLAMAGAASNIALTGMQAVQVVFLIRVVGLRPAAVGLLIAAVSFGGVAGAMCATRIARRFGTARGYLLCAIGCTPFALLMPLAAPGVRLLFFAVGGAFVGAGVVAGNVIKGTFRQAYCPRELLGRVMTTMQFVNLGAIPIGALVGGALGSAIGERATLWIMAGTLVASTGLLLVGPLRSAVQFPVREKVLIHS